MVIAVDTLFMSKRFRYTGTAMYLSRLLTECLKLAATATPPLEFHGFRPPNEDWANNGFVSPHLRVHRVPLLAWRRLWLLGGMALHTARLRPDVVFVPTPHHSVPAWFTRTVMTVHDAISRRIPESVGITSKQLDALTRLNVRLARRIITVSEWSKKDLVELYGISPVKIKVTYEGYNNALYNSVPANAAASAELLQRVGIRAPYVLHHGMLHVRKNIHRLVNAWTQLRMRRNDLDLQLVLAGPPGHGYRDIRKAVAGSPVRGQIILTGALTNRELALLVKNASLCVIPSLYEGFCLPMVEAMACGVPTIASNASCIPEISGGVLDYFDPYSEEEMAATIERALDDSSLRGRLREKGLARAAEFSWTRCAADTLQVFVETATETMAEG